MPGPAGALLEPAPHLALRSDDGVEAGISAATSSCAAPAGWRGRLRESWPGWLQEVPLGRGAQAAVARDRTL
ncbi:MAG: hypothetical protein E6J41_03025 [Chloroflexi bacterium]|nr:MAG: hypothetical protein E6J41_03025 [Chloroflexota bacterium]